MDKINNDAVSVAPHLHTILEDNDRVRVLQVTVNPGDKAEMHAHPDYVTVVLQGGLLEVTDKLGLTKTVELKTGSCSYTPATQHAVINNSDTTVEFINIELK